MSAPHIITDGNGLLNEQVLAQALTSDNNVTRIAARAMASDWVRGLAAWLSDECERNPGNKRVDVLHALADIQVQTFASLMAQMMSPGGDRHATDLYMGLIRDRVPETAAAIRKAMETLR